MPRHGNSNGLSPPQPQLQTEAQVWVWNQALTLALA